MHDHCFVGIIVQHSGTVPVEHFSMARNEFSQIPATVFSDNDFEQGPPQVESEGTAPVSVNDARVPLQERSCALLALTLLAKWLRLCTLCHYNDHFEALSPQ